MVSCGETLFDHRRDGVGLRRRSGGCGSHRGGVYGVCFGGGCGACRQVLSEFGRDFRIDAVGPRGTASWTMAELLPAAFGRDQLS